MSIKQLLDLAKLAREDGHYQLALDALEEYWRARAADRLAHPAPDAREPGDVLARGLGNAILCEAA